MGKGTGLAQEIRALYRGVGPLGIRVTRPESASDLRTLHSSDMFAITGGEILLTSIYGKVTAAMETAATFLTLRFTPTDGVATDMCLVSITISDHAINTIYHITGDITAVMEDVPGQPELGIGYASFETCYQIMCPGTISIVSSNATNADGIIRWSLHYVPLEAASRVTWIV